MFDVRKSYIDAEQGQLFEHFEDLDDLEKKEFLSNLKVVADRIVPSKLVADCQKAIALSETNKNSTATISPLPESSYYSIIGKKDEEEEYEKLGLEAISKGEVAVILMAGGQGTRLGSSQPKGCYDIGLPSHKSLFQIQAEKILRLQQLTKTDKDIPWYIMTSKPTRKATEQFFKDNSYFNLKESQITFFNQGTLPAFDMKGEKLFLGSRTGLVESPDGNGGLYRALKDNHILDGFKRKNIKHVYMYCVDNVLSKVADPVFIGFAIKHSFSLATKAVRKRDASESVGIIATKNDKPCVIEYSEISKELAESKNEEGLLTLRAANIVNHYYSVSLLEKELSNWCNNMSYHIAKKKIPYFDSKSNKLISPTEPNGIKLEQFIFDVFPTVNIRDFGCLEVERSHEFAPLKNAPGSANDNPESSRAAYMNLGTCWLRDAGAKVQENVLVEVPGIISYGGENLNVYQNKVFDTNDMILM